MNGPEAGSGRPAASGRFAASGRLAALGPGILFAAAAIGVSHVVQSTRAGAVYGLAMVALIAVIGIVKYPAIRFGSQYTAATGKSLPENYIDQGWWAVSLYLVTQLLTVWFVLAAIAVTTAGLVLTVFDLAMGPVALTGWLMAGTALLLTIGHYRWLERVGKALVFVLVVMVVIAAGAAVPKIDWSVGNFAFERIDVPVLLFVVAMAGWLPTPVDASILTSVWTSAKLKASGTGITSTDARFDFNLGYVTAMVLAVGFLLLGVAVMHEPGIAPRDSPPEFAAQVIALFTETVGGWSFYLIGAAAIAAMFSTLLAAMDGYPRQFAYAFAGLRGTEAPRWFVPALVWACALGSYLLLAALLTSFTRFIDLTTTLGFVMAPIYAFLNHRAMTGAEVQEAYRPSRGLRLWSLVSLVILALASVIYLYVRFVHG